jgi:Type II intron maturase
VEPVRGVVQYYLLAHNVGWFSKWRWVSETSLLKTLAGKHQSSVAAMARKFKATTETINSPRKCLKVVVQRREKKPLVAQFGGIPLQWKQDAILVD